MQLATYLHVGKGEPPEGYTEYYLCTQVYHCLPSELAEEDWETIRLHMEFMSMENQVREHRRKAAANKAEQGRRAQPFGRR